jgi:hypothetical protein
MDLDFSLAVCMMQRPSSDRTEIFNNINSLQILLSQYEQLCTNWSFTKFAVWEDKNPEEFPLFRQRYELQEQIREFITQFKPYLEMHSSFAYIPSRFSRFQDQFGEIFYIRQTLIRVPMVEDIARPSYVNVYLKTNASAGGPLQQELRKHMYYDEQKWRIFIHSLAESGLFVFKKTETIPAWNELQNNQEKNYNFFRDLIKITDQTFLNLKTDLNILKNSIPPMIAESKNSTMEAIQTDINDFINARINNMGIHLNELESIQQNFVTNIFIEQLKSTLLNKQEEIQHKNQQALINLEIRQQATQSQDLTALTNTIKEKEQFILKYQAELMSNLKKDFEEKLSQAYDKINNIATQNKELKKTITHQILENKNQRRLIKNLTKNFEAELKAKNKIIKKLKTHAISLESRIDRIETALMTGRGFVEPATTKQEANMVRVASTTETCISSQIKQAQAVHCAEIKQVANLQQETRNQLAITQAFARIAATKP